MALKKITQALRGLTTPFGQHPTTDSRRASTFPLMTPPTTTTKITTGTPLGTPPNGIMVTTEYETNSSASPAFHTPPTGDGETPPQGTKPPSLSMSALWAKLTSQKPLVSPAQSTPINTPRSPASEANSNEERKPVEHLKVKLLEHYDLTSNIHIQHFKTNNHLMIDLDKEGFSLLSGSIIKMHNSDNKKEVILHFSRPAQNDKELFYSIPRERFEELLKADQFIAISPEENHTNSLSAIIEHRSVGSTKKRANQDDDFLEIRPNPAKNRTKLFNGKETLGDATINDYLENGVANYTETTSQQNMFFTVSNEDPKYILVPKDTKVKVSMRGKYPSEQFNILIKYEYGKEKQIEQLVITDKNTIHRTLDRLGLISNDQCELIDQPNLEGKVSLSSESRPFFAKLIVESETSPIEIGKDEKVTLYLSENSSDSSNVMIKIGESFYRLPKASDFLKKMNIDSAKQKRLSQDSFYRKLRELPRLETTQEASSILALQTYSATLSALVANNSVNKAEISMEFSTGSEYKISDTETIPIGTKVTITQSELSGFTLSWNNGKDSYEFHDYSTRVRKNKTTHPHYNNILKNAQNIGFPQPLEYYLTASSEEVEKFIAFLEKKSIPLNDDTKDELTTGKERGYILASNKHINARNTVFSSIQEKGLDLLSLLKEYELSLTEEKIVKYSKNNMKAITGNIRASLPTLKGVRFLPLIEGDQHPEPQEPQSAFDFDSDSEDESTTEPNRLSVPTAERRTSLPLNLPNADSKTLAELTGGVPFVNGHKRDNSHIIISKNTLSYDGVATQKYLISDDFTLDKNDKFSITFTHMGEYTLKISTPEQEYKLDKNNVVHSKLITHFHYASKKIIPLPLLDYLSDKNIRDNFLRFIAENNIHLSEEILNNLQTINQY